MVFKDGLRISNEIQSTFPPFLLTLVQTPQIIHKHVTNI